MGYLDQLSAALRHLRDAEHLAGGHDGRSLDQAYHLGGLAPECARKATLSERVFDQAIGHGVGDEAETALAMALTRDLRGQRYRTTGLGTRHPALRVWTENCRYERSGSRDERAVAALLTEARDVVDSLAFALWLDGCVPGDFAW
jgi:hypothetical protein